MLHVDPELLNPKVDNKFLMSGNRINPLIGIAGEDVIEGAGIEIERLENGKIKISVVEDESEESESIINASNYFSVADEIDLFSIMPTSANVYHFVFEDGIDYESFERTGYERNYNFIDRNDSISSLNYDESGDVISEPENNTLPNPSVTYSLKDSSYTDGVGVLFTIISSVLLPIFLIQISSNGSFTELSEEVYTTDSEKFISLSGYSNGIYYYRVRVIGASTGEQSPFVAGYFNFNGGV